MYLPDFFTVYLSGSGLILPKHQTITLENTADNFGDAYNNVVHQAMDDGHNDILVCNDDIVFNPYTWPTLAEDLKRIPADTRGWVATRSDYAREDVRTSGTGIEGDKGGLKHDSEGAIVEVDVIAPICAWIESLRTGWTFLP
jgi:GR25 family glycosyltransferase involved in LPS biosynthesis